MEDLEISANPINSAFSHLRHTESLAVTNVGTHKLQEHHKKHHNHLECRTIAETAIADIGAILTKLSTADKCIVWSKLLGSGHGTLDAADVKTIVSALSKYVNVELEFMDFVRGRAKKKKQFYFNVLLFALLLFVAAVVVQLIGLVTTGPMSEFETPLSALLRVSCIILFSLVPGDQLDIIALLLEIENRVILIRFSVIMSILFGTAGYIFYIFEYSNHRTRSSFIIVSMWSILAVWFLGNLMAVSQDTQLINSTNYGMLPRWVSGKLSYEMLSLKCRAINLAIVMTIFVDGIYYIGGSWGLQDIDFAARTVWLLGTLAAMVYQFYTRPPGSQQYEMESRGLVEFNQLLYVFCVGSGIFYVAYGVYAIKFNLPTPWNCLIAAVFDFIPMAIVLCLGMKRSLSLVVHYLPWLNFDNSIPELHNDGVFMSALVLSCFIQSDKMWIYRDPANECRLHNYRDCRCYAGCVDRRKWILGKRVKDILNDDNTVSAVEVQLDYREDIDEKWRVFFNGFAQNFKESSPVITTHTLSSGIASTGESKDVSSFDRWCIQLGVDEIHRDYSLLRATTTVSPTLKFRTKEDLDQLKKDFGRARLRTYQYDPIHWTTEHADWCLLSKSPREKDENDRRRIYGLSKELKEIKTEADKIDFFISHSWSDDAEKKRTAIVKFAEEFLCKNKRYPTFWLDKVCIDQSNKETANMGVAMLPINVNACKGVLILMGDTYMERLWCIWELYTLFTFRNKESVQTLVKILPLISRDDVESKLDEFDIENAHCFDPNEELKLRYLMLGVIGKDKVTESIKAMKLIETSVNVATTEDASLASSAVMNSSKKEIVVDASSSVIVRIRPAAEDGFGDAGSAGSTEV